MKPFKPLLLTLCIATALQANAGTRAEDAKVAYDKLTEQWQLSYEKMAKINWLFESISMKQTDYQAGEDQSIAKMTYTIKFLSPKDIKGATPITEEILDTIIHDKKTVEEGLVAHIIESTTKVDEKFTPKTTIDIFKDGKVDMQAIYKSYSEDDYHFKGAGMHFLGHLDTLDHNGEMQIEFKGLEGEINIPAFSINVKYNHDLGEYGFNSTPIKIKKAGSGEIDLGEINIKINVKASDIKGLESDDTYFLSHFNFSIANFKMVDNRLPVPVTFDKMSYSYDLTSKDDAVDASASLNLLPTGDWINTLSQGKINLSKLDAKISADRIPSNVVAELSKLAGQAFKDFYSVNANASDEKYKKMFAEKAEQWLSDIQKAEFGLSLKLDMDTSKGNVFADVGIHLKDANMDYESIQKTLKNPASDIFKLLEIKGKASIPATFAEENKLQFMLAMVFEKDGETYFSDIKTDGKQLLINDTPFDITPFLPDSTEGIEITPNSMVHYWHERNFLGGNRTEENALKLLYIYGQLSKKERKKLEESHYELLLALKEQFPNKADFTAHTCWYALVRNKLDVAKTTCPRAYEIEPNSRHTAINMGHTHYINGDKALAEKLYVESLKKATSVRFDETAKADFDDLSNIYSPEDAKKYKFLIDEEWKKLHQ